MKYLKWPAIIRVNSYICIRVKPISRHEVYNTHIISSHLGNPSADDRELPCFLHGVPFECDTASGLARDGNLDMAKRIQVSIRPFHAFTGSDILGCLLHAWIMSDDRNDRYEVARFDLDIHAYPSLFPDRSDICDITWLEGKDRDRRPARGCEMAVPFPSRRFAGNGNIRFLGCSRC